MSAPPQVQPTAARSPFPGILGVMGFLAAGLTMVTVRGSEYSSPAEMATSSWLGWTFVGAIWALALGLILGTLWQEYKARISAASPHADESDDDDDDSPGMPGRYLIH